MDNSPQIKGHGDRETWAHPQSPAFFLSADICQKIKSKLPKRLGPSIVLPSSPPGSPALSCLAHFNSRKGRGRTLFVSHQTVIWMHEGDVPDEWGNPSLIQSVFRSCSLILQYSDLEVRFKATAELLLCSVCASSRDKNEAGKKIQKQHFTAALLHVALSLFDSNAT